MSFILDALKKSENDRQRQSGPALFEVKVATPKAGLPLWAVALALLLVVNIGVVVWLVLRKPAQTQTAPLPVAVAAAAPAPAPAVPPPVVESAPPPPALNVPSDQPEQPTTSAEEGEPLNPEDYEPAIAPGSNTPPKSTGNVTRRTMEGLPTYEEASANGSLPELRIDMHVYSAKPQDRFVFINMQRMREGDALPDGVRVEQITTDGVVLSFQGKKFVLEHE